jgi:hypothetical protein
MTAGNPFALDMALELMMELAMSSLQRSKEEG